MSLMYGKFELLIC